MPRVIEGYVDPSGRSEGKAMTTDSRAPQTAAGRATLDDPYFAPPGTPSYDSLRKRILAIEAESFVDGEMAAMAAMFVDGEMAAMAAQHREAEAAADPVAGEAVRYLPPSLLQHPRREKGSQRKFGPKKADHPSIGKECPACFVPFKEGDYTTIVLYGPGDDDDARQRRDEGRPYNAVAGEVHWDCSEQQP